MMINNITYKKVLLSFGIFTLFFLFTYSSSLATNHDIYTEDGTRVSETGVQQGASDCTTTGFKYKTLVTIPGLGEDGVVTICPSSLGTYLQTIFNYIIGIAIALAVVMIIYGGVTYATTDAVGGKAEGKTIIKDALYGLALALGSFLILNTINPDLLKFDLELPVLKTVVTQDGGSVAVVRYEPLQNGSSPSALSSGRPSGRAIACSGGLVTTNDFGRNVTICSNLLQKFRAVKTLTPNTPWVITSTVTGRHSSTCHSPGNERSGSCADIAIRGGTWGELCRAIRNTPGLSALNEVASSPECVAALGPFARTTNRTGDHLHINLIAN